MSSAHEVGIAAGGDPPDEHDPPPRGQTTIDRACDISGDDHELRLRLAPTNRAAGTARAAMREWLAAFDLDEQIADGMLVVVSELVTNAVHHAMSPCEVIATMNADGLRLEVHDHLTDPPVLRARDRSNFGYGMRLVAALTDRWGWRPTTTGKYVWAETTCDQTVSACAARADAMMEADPP